MEINGKVVFVNPKRDVTEKFSVRELGLDVSQEVNGTVYDNYVSIQFSNAKCDLLEGLNIGDEISVIYSVNGTIKTKKDTIEPTEKNPNSEVIYVNLNGTRVNVISRAQQQSPVRSQPQELPTASPAVAAPTQDASDDLPF